VAAALVAGTPDSGAAALAPAEMPGQVDRMPPHDGAAPPPATLTTGAAETGAMVAGPPNSGVAPPPATLTAGAAVAAGVAPTPTTAAAAAALPTPTSPVSSVGVRVRIHLG